MEDTEISHVPPTPAYMQLPLDQNSSPRVIHLLQSMNLHWHIIISSHPSFILGFTLSVIHPVGFDKCIMTCIHHYSIIQNGFTILKILCALPIHPSLSPNPPESTDHFTVSMVLLFPKCHIVGIKQYVAFLGLYGLYYI